ERVIPMAAARTARTAEAGAAAAMAANSASEGAADPGALGVAVARPMAAASTLTAQSRPCRPTSQAISPPVVPVALVERVTLATSPGRAEVGETVFRERVIPMAAARTARTAEAGAAGSLV